MSGAPSTGGGRPVVLVGCGRLGSAIVEGWLLTGAVDPAELIILTPSEKPVADVARAKGARVNPPAEALAIARAVVLSVKPAYWKGAVDPLAPVLPRDATIVSVMAGVRTASIGAALAPRPIVRVMPTTAVASGNGIAAVWSAAPEARAVAHALFAPLAEVVDLDEERHMDVATAVAGSGPAYVHAFTRALAAAGEEAGLDPDSALKLARGAVRSAASADPSEGLDALIARVASPGGTTEAGLKALNQNAELDGAVEAAVIAALLRARELASGG
jgi:pyrroline-5-carboxylate reductase